LLSLFVYISIASDRNKRFIVGWLCGIIFVVSKYRFRRYLEGQALFPQNRTGKHIDGGGRVHPDLTAELVKLLLYLGVHLDAEFRLWHEGKLLCMVLKNCVT
jgi:hypothetical protein